MTLTTIRLVARKVKPHRFHPQSLSHRAAGVSFGTATPPSIRLNADLEAGYAIRIRLIGVLLLAGQQRVIGNLDKSLETKENNGNLWTISRSYYSGQHNMR